MALWGLIGKSSVPERAIAFATEGLKTMLLLNGGAAVAMLTLAGSMAKNESKYALSLPEVSHSIECFSFGSLAVGITFFLGYLAEAYFGGIVVEDKSINFGNILRYIGVLTSVASMTLFFAGTLIGAGSIVIKP